ncbi:DUF2510 domain-containing protein [Schumannella sp. 10F1B-5-1]|uniref:DUF2510 domain-containing protein n=1 Tax=Schumannella sp. 10F1B-5-1 TaxID=2590780 RepID=UPI00113110BC|nr:DUF2510 domain-containing protein [Schumannella sp. 10F1B-5-1]TPW78424.1 DUF2510 domain-containing protein [Schumannella sp. 10F1B-5-1]
MSDERQQAGWYPDPSGARQLRWWNGKQFTDLISDVEDDAQTEVATALLTPAAPEPVPVEPIAVVAAVAEPAAAEPVAAAPAAPTFAAPTFADFESAFIDEPVAPAATVAPASAFPPVAVPPVAEPVPLPANLDLPAPSAADRIGGGLDGTLDMAALADFEAQLAADFSPEPPAAPEPSFVAAPAAFAAPSLDDMFSATLAPDAAAVDGALTFDQEIAQLLESGR